MIPLRVARILFLAGMVGVSGCAQEHDTPGATDDVAALADLVTGSASGALGPDGQFHIAASPAPGEVSRAQAEQFASAYAHQFSPFLRGELEAAHGGSIDFASLHVCGAARYAESPFGQLPATIPPIYHRFFGSWWIIGFCDHGELPAVSVAVSALSTSLTIENGRLRLPAQGGGNYFRTVGVPQRWGAPVASSPERAALTVARAAGRRIAAPPELIAPDPRDGYPQGALWRIQLDSSATLREVRSGARRSVAEVYFGAGRTVGRAAGSDTGAVFAASLRDTEPYRARIDFNVATGRPPSVREVELPRRPGYVVRIEKATVSTGEGN